jgi:YfiH family protein
MKIFQSSALLSIDFVKHGFLGKTDESEQKNHETLIKDRFLSKNDVQAYFGKLSKNLIILDQKHSNTVCIVTQENKEYYWRHLIRGDAIITACKDVLIGVYTADCAPILLCDPEKKIIAAIHAGWKGAVCGIIEETLSKLEQLGCQNVIAAMGPAITQRSFEVGAEFHEKIEGRFLVEMDSHLFFNLKSFVVEHLLSNKIVRDVSIINIDTFLSEEFFSYRRHKQNNAATNVFGVQLSGIVMLH